MKRAVFVCQRRRTARAWMPAWLAAVGIGWSAGATAVDLPLTDETVVRFANEREGAAALVRRDDYIKQMSPFDRQVRLKTNRDPAEQELLAYMARNVVPWTAEDIEKLKPLIASLGKKLAPWNLNLPPVVLLVKTTGLEEGGAAYCRGPAIVLPQNVLDRGASKLNQLLPHELFHVLSSHNPELRDKLYAIIGFQSCNEVQLPEPLRSRKITNPDAPVNRHYIAVRQNGELVELMPVLLSKSARYDPARGGTLFDYLDFKLLQLENDDGQRRPAIVNGQAVLWDPAHVPDFAVQIGRNTNYIIHPEEILADNFVFLLDGRVNLPTPRVVEEMGKVLQGDDGAE